MDPCKKNEPTVIDNALLEKCISEQGPKGEAGRLAHEEGIPLEEIDHIRLESLKILRIDHLWIMTGLTKLSISQNLIEKIENLESLINLKELDLSFNKISKIENIQALVNLEILSFFDNRISEMENMDTLKKLVIFSIGRNEIEDEDNVFYLRRFKNLRSLNMAGNPCANSETFRTFIATFLPQIVYYEYRMIQDSERETGLTFYGKRMRDLRENEADELDKVEKAEQALAAAEIHSLSFVEYLGGRELFDSLFENDHEGNLLLGMGDEVTEYYNEYEEAFISTTKTLFEYGQQQYEVRKAEIDMYTKCIDEAKAKSQKESIEQMEVFLKTKADIFLKIKKLQDDFEYGGDPTKKMNITEFNERMENYSNEVNDLIHNTWKTLMQLELNFYEQTEETTQLFEHTITEMINTFIELSQGYFAQLREQEVTYTENIGEIGNRLLTEKTINDDLGLPEELETILGDREFYNNTIGTSHDLHMLLIDNREDTLMKRARTWLDDLMTTSQKNEIKRNRSKILEINHFLDIQREEFEEVVNNDVTTVVDPDISAALG